MKKQVWKYNLGLLDVAQEINMPIDSKIVHVGVQGDNICLWVEVCPSEDTASKRSFKVFGTEHPISEGIHVGTAIMPPFVWHVYEITE